jgi:hypothetical protein
MVCVYVPMPESVATLRSIRVSLEDETTPR